MPSREKSLSLLSRLVQKIGSPNGLGGVPTYPWEVVAGALAGLPRGHVALVRAVYSLDHNVIKVAALELQLNMEMDQVIKSWRCTKSKLYGLCFRVVLDCVWPLKCRRCNGRGIIYPKGRAIRKCDVCDDGSELQMSPTEFAKLGKVNGNRDISARELAIAIGVGADRCGKGSDWRGRYDIVARLADDWIMESARHLQIKLGD